MSKNILKDNLVFLMGWLLITLLFTGYILSHTKGETFILLNPWHTRFLDIFFQIVTVLGNGWFVIAAGILFLIFKQKKLSILILSSYAFSGILVQILKNLFPAARPKLFFEHYHIHYEYFLKDITLHSINSFPSGHTASAFALFTALAFMIRKKSFSLLLLVAAVLTGYSRIYLGQHFPEDVITGAALGTFSAIVCYIGVQFIYEKKQNKLNE